MKHIVIDFEMNKIDRKHSKEKKICSREIIQIGAVVLDENYKEIGSFSTLVKPQYNSVIEYDIQKLTGISAYNLKNAPDFLHALDSFFEWIRNMKDEACIYAWSENDLNQLLAESTLKEYVFDSFEENLLENWFDFQKEYEDTMMLGYHCSLVEALMQTGIQVEGKLHDALNDAHNTANLLAFIRNEDNVSHSFRAIMNNQESTNCTLADLFDFSQFDFA